MGTGTGGHGREERGTRNHDGHRRSGLGYHHGSDSHRQRSPPVALTEPTTHEVSRTIFVEVLPNLNDSKMEMILRAVGRLRRWIRAKKPDGTQLGLGLAEYEDAESLEAAIAVLTALKVSVIDAAEAQAALNDINTAFENGEKEIKIEETDAEETDKNAIKEVPLKIYVDEKSRDYAEEWRYKRNEDPSVGESRLAKANFNVEQALESLNHVPAHSGDADGDALMTEERVDPVTGQVLTISIGKDDDELDMVPEDQRDNVQREIHAFRERSLRRDLERQQIERTNEAAHRNAIRAPTGPANGANEIPVGPRGAPPNAPRSMQATQPQHNSLNSANRAFPPRSTWITAALEDGTISDDGDIERLRLAMKKQREAPRDAPVQKSQQDKEKQKKNTHERKMKKKMDTGEARTKRRAEKVGFSAKFNSKQEAHRSRRDQWFKEPSSWVSTHTDRFRKKKFEDEKEQVAEEAQNRNAMEVVHRDHQTPNIQPADNARPAAPVHAPIKLSKLKLAPQLSNTVPKRSALAMEAMLEDQAAEQQAKRRPIKKLKLDEMDEGVLLTDAQRKAARAQILETITRDKTELFNTTVDSKYLTNAILDGPITERANALIRKMVPNGTADFIPAHVVERIRSKTPVEDIVKEVAIGLTTRAEEYVSSLWRFVIYTVEVKKRGLADE